MRSLLFAAIFYPLTFLCVLGGIVASWFGRRAMLAVVLAWADMHHWLTASLLGIRVRVEGEIPAEPCLIAAKHEAMFETIEMVRIAQLPVIVIKRELADIPLFGRLTRRYGVIPVERSAGAKALRTLVAEGRAAAAAGRQVIIYPEGTRVVAGQAPPLRPGFAGLYRAIGLPVVPVAHDSGRLWGRGLLKRAGVITFKIGPQIPAGLPREDIERKVHDAINALN
jgi:1-acyl-sn-glycerol-3-phosphate acyltransferase